MTRLGRRGVVHLWEEPIFEGRASPGLAIDGSTEGVKVITPFLPNGLEDGEVVEIQRLLLDGYVEQAGLQKFIAWYYTPMALQFSDHLHPAVTVYDCMDELSAFQSAPPELIDLEHRLFAKSDVVFAGGASLYASKRAQHRNVHLFPSSIDYFHFAAARQVIENPADQNDIPHPRIGFFGVLDERLDRDLLRDVASLHPEWQFILIGPVVKIRKEDLPQGPNLHYLGQKLYRELPAYLAHWNVAMLPFARNASTRFISPTKTPEYLAAGRPVVSTPIQDVVSPYGEMELVQIAANAHEFGDAIALCLDGAAPNWLPKVDRFLRGNSWDKTFEAMWEEIQRCMSQGSLHVPHTAVSLGAKEHADV